MTKILHTGIAVKNMEESLAFYTEVLGFKKTGGHDMPRLKLAFLQGENQAIELLDFVNDNSQKPEGVISHFAIEVDDMAKAIAKIKAAGIILASEEIRELEGMKIFFFNGPNGEMIEMVQQAK